MPNYSNQRDFISYRGSYRGNCRGGRRGGNHGGRQNYHNDGYDNYYNTPQIRGRGRVKRQRVSSTPRESTSVSPNVTNEGSSANHKLKADVIIGAISKSWRDDQQIVQFKTALRPPRKLLKSRNNSKVFDKDGVDHTKYLIRSVIEVLERERGLLKCRNFVKRQ